MKTPAEVAEEINKALKEEVMVPASKLNTLMVARVSWGVLPLDAVTGGFPLGRFVELFGPEGCGKTTLSLNLVAQHQQQRDYLRTKGVPPGIAYFDCEGSLDYDWMKHVGVDVRDENLFINRPDSSESALDQLEALIESGAYGLLVLDSVAIMSPTKEVDDGFGGNQVGLHARLMNKACRKFQMAKNRTVGRVSAVFINQIREKIGVVFGSPETTPGGRGLKFLYGLRIRLNTVEKLFDAKDVKKERSPIGIRTGFKVHKCKVGPGFGAEGSYVLGLSDGGQPAGASYGLQKGKFDNFGALSDIARDFGVLEYSAGGWYNIGDVRLHGREAFETFLIENPDTFSRLWNEVQAAIYQRYRKDEIMEEGGEKGGKASGGKTDTKKRGRTNKGGRTRRKSGTKGVLGVQGDGSEVVQGDRNAARKGGKTSKA